MTEKRMTAPQIITPSDNNKQQIPEFDQNPLNGLNPVSKYKIFDVFYEDEDSFRVLTTTAVPNIAYLYEGEQQIVRITLSPDNKRIQMIDIATDSARVKNIINRNPSFPFRPQLEKKVGMGDASPVSLESELSPEVVQEAEMAFKKAFASDGFMLVPAELIGSILREQPDAIGSGLHIPSTIEGSPNPMLEEYFRYAFGWFLGNGYEVNEAQQLARDCVYTEKVLITENLHISGAAIEKQQLVLHEGIHRFFIQLLQSSNPQVQKLGVELKQVYSVIPLSQKFAVEQLFDREKYTFRQRPEEFWTYYISALAYAQSAQLPPNHPIYSLIELGKNQAIQKVMSALPFLKEFDHHKEIVLHIINTARVIRTKL